MTPMRRTITEGLPSFMQWEPVPSLVGSRRTASLVARPATVEDCRETLAFCRRNGLTVCPRGSGHSYGDLALNDGHVLLETTRMDRILGFDEATGRLSVEPGVRIIDVYRRVHDRLFTLPASPTEAAITVAGAIAANVNGKDAWRRGNFGERVVGLKLLKADGGIASIERTRDPELFRAVVGGLGLLGVIVEATLQLERIPSPFLRISRLPASGIAELLAQLEQLEATSDFAVVWLDACSRASRFGRGVIHATRWIDPPLAAERLREEVAAGFGRLERRRRQALALYGVVESAISAALELPWPTVRFFNGLYYAYSVVRRRLGIADNVELFLRYNFDASFTVPPPATMCGPLGYTIQVSVPKREAHEAITELIEICQAAPCPPVTTIMRLHRRDDCMLSFSENGYSLNFEFHPKRRHEARMRPFVDALIECVIRRRGKVHLAKDMILTRDQFRRLHPELERFAACKRRLDPEGLFASDASRRLLGAAALPRPTAAPAPEQAGVEVALSAAGRRAAAREP
jgi:FAD/FMN-containing dehydrogenase